MSRSISVDLTVNGIDNLIDELDKFEKMLKDNCDVYCDQLADIGVASASQNFATAIYDGDNDVTVSKVNRKKGRVVRADGNATLFIEFGTGVNYDTSHPDRPSDLAPVGTYGQGKGSNPNGWTYYGAAGSNGKYVTSNKNGDVYRTQGNPSNKCMYSAVRDVKRSQYTVARRVFK